MGSVTRGLRWMEDEMVMEEETGWGPERSQKKEGKEKTVLFWFLSKKERKMEKGKKS